MALGWCPVCKTLGTIQRLPTMLREGQIDYGRVIHDEPPVHAKCKSRVSLISEDAEPNIDGAEFRCPECGVIPPEQVEYPPGRCLGSRKPIR